MFRIKTHKIIKALLVLAFLATVTLPRHARADDDQQPTTTSDPSSDDGSDDSDYCRALPIKIQP